MTELPAPPLSDDPRGGPEGTNEPPTRTRAWWGWGLRLVGPVILVVLLARLDRPEEILRLFREMHGWPFALAMVLNRYFAMYASVNSFTQLVIRSAQRQGDWYTWDPMSGQKRVL